MCLSCADCGISLVKNPNGRNTPKRCFACAKKRANAKASARQKTLVRAARETAKCCDCGASIPQVPRRGPLKKRCDSCSRLAEKIRCLQRPRNRPHDIQCQQCGGKFRTARKRQKYCSAACSHLADRDRVRVCCERCGLRFEHSRKRGISRRFCSRDCWCKSHRRATCQCQQCGKDFPRKAYSNPWQGKNKFCSRECAWDHRWGKDRPRKGGSKKARISWAQRSHATTLKHRCRHYGCHFDPACTRKAVCERDGWVCQRCGIQCNKGEYLVIPGTRRVDPKNADHDHIWPLSIPGGPGNVLSNSQCLCRKCNGKKRAKGGSQLRLAFAG